MKVWLTLALIVLVNAVVFWFSPIRPVAFHPDPTPPFSGVLKANTALTKARVSGRSQIVGGEDIAMDSKGNLYTGDHQGVIWRRDADSQQWQEYARDPLIKRAIGLTVDASDNVIVCDAFNGLLLIDSDQQVQVLVNQANGRAFGLTDDVDIGPDGTIYFSDATTRYDVNSYKLEALESVPSGRLLAYDPVSKQTRVLLSDLFFANGVAVSPAGDFVLVNETYAYRVTRYWLKGDKAGQSDIFADNLPGFPDGISSVGNGEYWIAFFAPRLALLDTVHPYPALKRWLGGLPQWLSPEPQPYGFVAKLDQQGNMVSSLHDPQGKQLSAVTSAEQYGTTLYMGSLINSGIGEIAVQVK